MCSVVFLLAGAFLALFVVYRLGYFSEHNTYTTFAEQKRILDEEKRQVVEQLNEAHEVRIASIVERLMLSTG